MKCYCCLEDKLAKEFPFYPLTENCNHPLLHCLDCATDSVKKRRKCSQCENKVTEDNEIYQEYLETLDFLFPPEEEIEDRDDNGYQAGCTAFPTGNIYVTTMSGESATLLYQPLKKISDIKKEVEKELKTPVLNQRLLYQNKELEVRNKDRKVLTLKDHNVPPNSTVHLIVLLCAVPDELDKVVFDFHWGLPIHRSRDYLDVSVLVYSGRSNLGIIYYRNRTLFICPGVEHSGPAHMDYLNDEGGQKVTVDLRTVPDHVDNLVFTLSAWASGSVSDYPYYTLKFYDVNFPNQPLCNPTVDVHHKVYKSIIMCSLSKKNGRWEVIEVKSGSPGFTRDYFPLKQNIELKIRNGFF